MPALLQYHISSGEDTVEVHVQRHQNRTKGQTAKRTIEKIHKGLSDSCSIGKVYRSALSASGGPAQASNPSVLPRGRKQVSNAKFARNGLNDPVNDLLLYARHKEHSPVLHHSDDFVTDWEEALIQAWSTEMPKKKHLCCFKHFKDNCKLRKIGITSTKHQKQFLTKVFGVNGKEEGILDAEDKKDLKRRLHSPKEELDRLEREVLDKNHKYECKFWKCLESNYEMMKNMIAKAWRQGGLKDGPNGKPTWSYTNP